MEITIRLSSEEYDSEGDPHLEIVSISAEKSHEMELFTNKLTARIGAAIEKSVSDWNDRIKEKHRAKNEIIEKKKLQEDIERLKMFEAKMEKILKKKGSGFCGGC